MSKHLNYGQWENLIAICAFRYALGRQTYVTGILSEFLIDNAAAFSETDRRQMVEDIDRAIADGQAGSPYDIDVWTRAAKALRMVTTPTGA